MPRISFLIFPVAALVVGIWLIKSDANFHGSNEEKISILDYRTIPRSKNKFRLSFSINNTGSEESAAEMVIIKFNVNGNLLESRIIKFDGGEKGSGTIPIFIEPKVPYGYFKKRMISIRVKDLKGKLYSTTLKLRDGE